MVYLSEQLDIFLQRQEHAIMDDEEKGEDPVAAEGEEGGIANGKQHKTLNLIFYYYYLLLHVVLLELF